MLDPERTTVVSGCPGAGKTTQLLTMVEQELEKGTPPDRIGYVSFTKAAQTEAIERASKRFNLKPRELPYFRTLHSLGFYMCGMSVSQVLDNRKTHLINALADYINMPLTGISGDDEFRHAALTGDRLMNIYNLSRTREVPLRQQYEESDEDFHWAELQKLAHGVSAFKAANDLHDFVDMLALFCEEAPSPQLDVVFVDEAQDLSRLQWRAVSKLARQARKVVVAGDDDQGIFAWAGADVGTFIGLKGTEVPLHQSYRVPRSIQREAAGIIGRVPVRRKKQWRPRDAEGAIFNEIDIEHVDMSEGEWLVLARNKKFLARAEHHLQNCGILYERQGRSSLKAQTAIKAWTRLQNGESVTKQQAIKTYQQMRPNHGFTERGEQALKDAPNDATFSASDLIRDYGLLSSINNPWFDVLDHMTIATRTYIRAAGQAGEKIGGKPRVQLETIHSAKGREADNVVVMLDMAPRTHDHMQVDPDNEHRVFYVGVTRAKQNLFIVQARNESRAYPLH